MSLTIIRPDNLSTQINAVRQQIEDLTSRYDQAAKDVAVGKDSDVLAIKNNLEGQRIRLHGLEQLKTEALTELQPLIAERVQTRLAVQREQDQTELARLIEVANTAERACEPAKEAFDKAMQEARAANYAVGRYRQRSGKPIHLNPLPRDFTSNNPTSGKSCIRPKFPE